MDPNSHSSIYVAPLQIRKISQDGSSVPPNGCSASLETISTANEVSQTQDHFQVAGETTSTIFQNYVRANYPFTPSASLSPSTITLSLDAGDLVLVHSIHTNGWADGTLLVNGARGWLPTNYCEAYEHAPMQPLLKGLTELWDLVRPGDTSDLRVFRSQDYMRGLIFGVRFLLEQLRCLTRDSPLIKQHERLRKTRKGLLADLSSLVKSAKYLQGLAGGSSSVQVVEESLDEMLLKAFKVVTRSVRLLDVWNDELQPPGFDAFQSPTTSARSSTTKDGSLSTVDWRRLTLGGNLPDRIHASVELQRSPVNRDLCFFDVVQKVRDDEPVAAAWEVPPTSYSRHTSRGPDSIPATRRMPSVHKPSRHRNPEFISDRLTFSYDAFLGVLASFLGSHLQSRSSSELLLTTQQAVQSCRDLQAVVESVLKQDCRSDEKLLVAHDAMYDAITSLVHAARDVFRPANALGDDLVFLPEDGEQLLNAAIACVRAAGECVDQARIILDKIGDFEWFTNVQHSPPAAFELAESLAVKTQGGAQKGPSLVKTVTSFHRRGASSGEFPPQIQIPEVAFSNLDLSLSSVPASAARNYDKGPTTTGTNVQGEADRSDATFPLYPRRQSSLMQMDAEVIDFMLSEQKTLAREVVLSTGSDSTYVSSSQAFDTSLPSATSTRATSPDDARSHPHTEVALRSSGSQATLAEEADEPELNLLRTAYAYSQELIFKDGQVMGGSLRALTEQLTSPESPPDALFVSTFYLTFRLFASPLEFAESLVARFKYVEETPELAAPVRLRVYNILKGWLESHWRHDCDDVALPFVGGFAREVLTPVLPIPGKRLFELTEQIVLANSPLVPRLISSRGKTNISIASYVSPDAPCPEPVISRSQLLALRNWKMGGPGVSVLDFDALELARQITLKVSSLFCSILPEELLATEWQKQTGSLAVNVHAMSTLSTDIANLVADSILQLEEPKKRAAIIKQWVKIASKCLQLSNFDSLMAIICSLNSSTILRLKKTWDAISQKTKMLLQTLSNVVDVSRNHVVLRQRLQSQSPPCLPFVGMYLTDLTFVDHGNQSTRKLNSETGSISVINFDKHMKTARIISDLQRFQVPYRLAEIPELQIWMQDQLIKVRASGEKSFQNHYRRSLILEPREPVHARTSPIGTLPSQKERDRFDFLAWTHLTREKPVASRSSPVK